MVSSAGFDGVPCWFTEAVPWAGPEVTESIVRVWVDSLAGPGESLARTFTLVEPSSATVARSAWATGGAFTSVTVTETVEVSDGEAGDPVVGSSPLTW